MSDRERIRRPEPARTDPVRNLSGAFRNGDSSIAGDAPASPGPAASNPFAWPGDDPVSRAVRASCDVVEKAVRRGFGLGRDPSPGPSGPPWMGGSPAGPWAGAFTTGQWVDAMTAAFAQWTQWLDAWVAMARSSSMGGGAEPAGAWPPAPAHPAPPATAALRLTVELRSARAVTVQLDLAPGADAALEVHGLLAPAAAAALPITDVTVAVADGGVTVALGSIEQHPAGTYAGAVLAAGRACGTLTVRLV
jgi:hypothetical protein